MTWNLGYNIAEFIFTWLAQFDILLEKFPVLKVAEGKVKFSVFENGYIPSKRLGQYLFNTPTKPQSSEGFTFLRASFHFVIQCA